VKERAGIQSVEVGFTLLGALAGAPGPLMLRDLAAAAGMSAAKAHRYLVSFQRLQLVTQDAGTTRYDLGPAALKLGLASLSRLDAVKLARERVGALGRVVDVLLPGVAGFCAPVFDADGHLALGVVALGPTSGFDSEWDGAVATALRALAGQLSDDLGHRP